MIEVVRRKPAIAVALTIMALLLPLYLRGESGSDEGKLLLDQGIELYREYEFERSQQKLRAALEILTDPRTRAEAHLYLGRIYIVMENVEEGKRQFASALRLVPALKLKQIEDPPKIVNPFNEVRDTLFGVLHIASVPPQAMVIEDDRELGRTPLTLDSLSEGDHDFVLRKDGFLDATLAVEVSPGREVSERVELVHAGPTPTPTPQPITLFEPGAYLSPTEPLDVERPWYKRRWVWAAGAAVVGAGVYLASEGDDPGPTPTPEPEPYGSPELCGDGPGFHHRGLAWQDNTRIWLGAESELADPEQGVFRLFALNTDCVRVSQMELPGGQRRAAGLTWDGSALRVLTTDPDTPRIYAVDTSGQVIGPPIPAPRPQCLDIGWDGTDLWVASFSTYEMVEIEPTFGVELFACGTPDAIRPTGLTHDTQYVWVSSLDDGRIYEVEPDYDNETCTTLANFVSEGSRGGARIWGLAYDMNGHVYAMHVRDSGEGEVWSYYVGPPDSRIREELRRGLYVPIGKRVDGPIRRPIRSDRPRSVPPSGHKDPVPRPRP